MGPLWLGIFPLLPELGLPDPKVGPSCLMCFFQAWYGPSHTLLCCAMCMPFVGDFGSSENSGPNPTSLQFLVGVSWGPAKYGSCLRKYCLCAVVICLCVLMQCVKWPDLTDMSTHYRMC